MKCDIPLNLFPWHLSLKYLILINRQMVFRTEITLHANLRILSKLLLFFIREIDVTS